LTKKPSTSISGGSSRSVILSDEFYKWVSSIVIISFIGGFLVNIVLGLSHWIGTAAFVLGILCFRGNIEFV
ncbi:hypothetical protein ACFHWD_09655, partial [Clostridium sp. MT-14]|uniref:hypothetical protein n=1 Tax=Clostridium sp. MT-14 TaxID=3348360 RepID=UPI0035F3DA4B